MGHPRTRQQSLSDPANLFRRIVHVPTESFEPAALLADRKIGGPTEDVLLCLCAF